MKLITEEMPEVESASEKSIDEVLSTDAFGKFAVLSASEEEFIQAACGWDPTDECAEFLKKHGSDPWILEFRDGPSSINMRANGFTTLSTVQRIFKLFLKGERTWVADFHWAAAPQ
jgi:hypothetical protein